MSRCFPASNALDGSPHLWRAEKIQRRNIARLASLLANGVKVSPGQTYPNGWDLSSGERLYQFATESMLEEAELLNHPNGRAQAMHG